jgi:cysteine desulfurase
MEQEPNACRSAEAVVDVVFQIATNPVPRDESVLVLGFPAYQWSDSNAQIEVARNQAACLRFSGWRYKHSGMKVENKTPTENFSVVDRWNTDHYRTCNMLALDYNALPPILMAALANMLSAAEIGGHPQSSHALGRHMRRVLHASAEQFKKALLPTESVGARKNMRLVWTSGRHETLLLGLFAVAEARRQANPLRRLILLGHDVGWQAVKMQLLHYGFEVVDFSSYLSLQNALQQHKCPEQSIAIVGIPWCNVDGFCPIQAADIHALAGAYSIPIYLDVGAAAGRIDLPWHSDNTILGVHGQAIGAPPGVGAIVLARHWSGFPLWYGGGQQEGWRQGTESVTLASALAAALSWQRQQHWQHIAAQRDRWIAQILSPRGSANFLEVDTRGALPNAFYMRHKSVDAQAIQSMCLTKGIQVGRSGANIRVGLPPYLLESHLYQFYNAVQSFN